MSGQATLPTHLTDQSKNTPLSVGQPVEYRFQHLQAQTHRANQLSQPQQYITPLVVGSSILLLHNVTQPAQDCLPGTGDCVDSMCELQLDLLHILLDCCYQARPKNALCSIHQPTRSISETRTCVASIRDVKGSGSVANLYFGNSRC